MCSHSPPRLLQNRLGIRRREFACPTFIGPERAAGDIEMRKDRNRLALAMVLLASGVLHCAAQPYATGAHIDTEYDFSQVRTFAFAMVPKRPLTSPHGEILRAALEEALQERGFEQVAEDEADLWISYDIGVLSAMSVSWASQSTLGQGRIIARAIDPATQHEVWYGWAEANLRAQADPERRVREAVAALFQNRVGSREPS
jgi:hypothetical protein